MVMKAQMVLSFTIQGIFKTNMRKAGVDHSVIMKIKGHTTQQMLYRYNTVDPEDGQKAVDQLQTYFQNHDQIITKHQKAATDTASNAHRTS